jgi:chromosome segregation protein
VIEAERKLAACREQQRSWSARRRRPLCPAQPGRAPRRAARAIETAAQQATAAWKVTSSSAPSDELARLTDAAAQAACRRRWR